MEVEAVSKRSYEHISSLGELECDDQQGKARFKTFTLNFRKGVRQHTISYISKSNLLQQQSPTTLDESYTNKLPTTPNQQKPLPKTPNHGTQSPRNVRSKMSLSELRMQPVRPSYQSGSSFGRPSYDYDMLFSPNVRPDDPMLTELLNLMEDIEDSEVGSVLDNDVFLRDSNGGMIMRSRNGTKLSEVSVPANTISHYLNQDVSSVVSREHQQQQKRTKKHEESFSLDPSTCIKLEKLETALTNLGLHPTIAECKKIRENVTVNSKGEVLYGDYVAVAKEILGFTELGDYSKTLHKESHLNITNEQEKGTSQDVEVKNQSPSEPDRRGEMSHYRDDLNRMRRERDDALREVQYFRGSLHDKDRDCLMLQDELERCKKDLADTKNECNILRRQTRHDKRIKTNERDQTISELEKELSMLRSKQGPDRSEFEDMQKRLVVLGCQLRKNEVSKRTYEVAVEKLTRYVQNLHVTMDTEMKKTEVNSETSRRRKKLQKLSTEAKETVKSVKMLLEEEPLPFGWEEVYSEDGGRYYMNHVTQTTSWIHPVSGVQHTKSKKVEKT